MPSSISLLCYMELSAALSSPESCMTTMIVLHRDKVTGESSIRIIEYKNSQEIGFATWSPV